MGLAFLLTKGVSYFLRMKIPKVQLSFLVAFMTWGFIFPRLVCFFGSCHPEATISFWMLRRGRVLTYVAIYIRLLMLATLPQFMANMWGYLR